MTDLTDGDRALAWQMGYRAGFDAGLAAGRARAIEEAAALLLRMRPFSAIGDAAAILSLKDWPINARSASADG